MTYDDTQVMEALEYASQRDERIRSDINKALASHDKNFFAQIVITVLQRLNQTVSDLRRFIDNAYKRFMGQE